VISNEDTIIQLEQEASHYPDGSYTSNLLLQGCASIRELTEIEEIAAASNLAFEEDNAALQKQVKLLQEALALNGGKQAKRKKNK
jgi:hypothetical protein